MEWTRVSKKLGNQEDDQIDGTGILGIMTNLHKSYMNKNSTENIL